MAVGGPLVLGALWVVVVPELRWRRWRWDLTDEGIDIQHGTLAVNRTLVPWIRVQHVDTQRGVFEQAFGLSTVSCTPRRQPHDPAAPRRPTPRSCASGSPASHGPTRMTLSRPRRSA